MIETATGFGDQYHTVALTHNLRLPASESRPGVADVVATLLWPHLLS